MFDFYKKILGSFWVFAKDIYMVKMDKLREQYSIALKELEPYVKKMDAGGDFETYSKCFPLIDVVYELRHAMVYDIGKMGKVLKNAVRVLELLMMMNEDDVNIVGWLGLVRYKIMNYKTEEEKVLELKEVCKRAFEDLNLQIYKKFEPLSRVVKRLYASRRMVEFSELKKVVEETIEAIEWVRRLNEDRVFDCKLYWIKFRIINYGVYSEK